METKERISQSSQEIGQKTSDDGAAHAMLICRRLFRILGVWPTNDPGIYYWRLILTNVSVVVCYCAFVIRSLPTILYLIFDSVTNRSRIEDVGRVTFVAIEGMKYFLLRSHRRNIDICIKHIEFDWLETKSPSSRKIMLQHARYGHLVTRICYTVTFSAATWYAILPFVVRRYHSHAAWDNGTKVVRPRSFALPSHFGTSIVQKSPYYEIIYASQLTATYILNTIGVASYSLAAVIVVHACGQLKILMAKLNELVDGGSENKEHDTVNRRMADIIAHHVRTLKLVSTAEKILRGICLVSIGGYTPLLCVAAYLIYTEGRADPKNPVAIISYLCLYSTFLLNIFSFCYIGELLSQECRKVGEVTYMIDWYRLPRKQALDLGFMMTMAHSSVTLTAGGAIQLSLRCFASVARTSIGYLNMLLTVTD